MRSWWSRGARTRRTRKGTTTATTVSTWRGKRAPAIGMRSNATSTTSCAACPIGRRTWRNSRIWPRGSRRRNGAAPGGITGSDGAYTADEMMASVAARELVDREVGYVGLGLPHLACNLARGPHAPRLVLVYASGAVGAPPARLPLSLGAP